MRSKTYEMLFLAAVQNSEEYQEFMKYKALVDAGSRALWNV